MTEHIDGPGTSLERAGNELKSMDAPTFLLVVTELALVALALAGASEQVKETYRYVRQCSRDTDRLAEQMAALSVDAETVAAHHDAAAVMRGVLDDAQAMSDYLEDLGIAFNSASAAHHADYGPVDQAVQNMGVPMADASFYSNR